MHKITNNSIEKRGSNPIVTNLVYYILPFPGIFLVVGSFLFYCCYIWAERWYPGMKNIDTIITAHNRRVILSQDTTAQPECYCNKKENCPLQGKCQETAILYQVTVEANDKTKKYIGITGGTFKQRYNNHKKSFRNEKFKKETQLSKYIWNLKKNNIQYKINWKILQK